jgi:integration host factor subunit alpha
MTLTKSKIVEHITETVRFKKMKRDSQQVLFPEFDYEGLSKKRAHELVETLLDIMKTALERGETVLISGFGKFQIKFKWARKGRNPQTGDSMILKSRRIVTFQCAKKLREKINQP